MATIQYQSTQNAINATGTVAVTKPVSLAVGDLMLAQALTVSNTAAVITPPSGWTQIATDTNANFYWTTFYRVANSSDVAASTFTFTNNGTGSFNMAVYVSRFTNNDTTTPLNVTSAIGTGATGGASLPLSDTGFTPTTSMGDIVTFVAGVGNGGNQSVATYASANNNPTWTEAYDTTLNIGGNQGGVAMAYASYPSPLATGNISATITSTGSPVNGRIVSVYIAPVPVGILTVSTAMLMSSIRVVLQTPLSIASSMLNPIVSDIANKWNNTTKHVSAWLNRNKS